MTLQEQIADFTALDKFQIDEIIALCSSHYEQKALNTYDEASIIVDTKVRERTDSHITSTHNLTNDGVKQIAIDACNLSRILHRKTIESAFKE